jgi:predicted nucleotidyltransferase
MNPKTQTMIAELQQHLSALYGDRLIQMIVFGSQARGDAVPGSDVDILVVLQGSVLPGEEIVRTGGIVSDLSLRFDAVISCVFMSEDRFKNRSGPLLRNIRREGIPV